MNSRRRNQAAFSLVEVTIALGIMAFCLVAVFGLLPTGYSSNQAAIDQTTAATIASGLINDIRQAPLTATSGEPQSPHYLISVPVQTGTSVITETHTLFLTQDGAVADTSADSATSAQDKNADPTKNPRFRATMVFTVPAIGTAPSSTTPAANHAATMLRLLITWPALADRTGGALPTSQSYSFETMVALDRN